MNNSPEREVELRSILESLLRTGGAARSVRRKLEDLLGQMSDAERETFLDRAFDDASGLLQGDSLKALQGIRKLIIAVRGVELVRGSASGVSEAHFSPGDEIRNRIMSLADGASRTLDACVFTITDDAISDALIAAHQRGVRVRIITDNLKCSDPGSDIRSLTREGLAAVTDHDDAHMHHKFCIVDRCVLVAGSYNWTLSAARSNLDDLIVTSDRVLVDRYRTRFEELWERFGGPALPRD